MFRRHLVERVQHRHRVHDRLGVVQLDGREVLHLGHLGGSRSTGPGPVGDDVAGHRQQPAAHRSPALDQTVGMLPRPEQGLLNDVLGRGAIAGQPSRIGQQALAVLFVERADQRLGRC
jgi:hypothetical protein